MRALTRDDFRRILTETEASLIKQYVALMATEGVTLEFTPDAIDAIADVAVAVNSSVENIGARRLQTVMERVLDEISFAAPDRSGEKVKIDAAYVRQAHRRPRQERGSEPVHSVAELLSATAPQPHIERAGTAMGEVRLLDREHIGTQVRQREPERHLPPEHAAAALGIGAAFAGDHQHGPGALALRAMQEAQQRRVRLALGAAVQVDAAVDLDLAAREPLLEPAIDRHQWRRQLGTRTGMRAR